MKVPEVEFKYVARRVAAHADPFVWNPHAAWLGMSRSGKSYAIRYGILPVYASGRIVVLDVKPGGERTWNGYGNPVDELSPGFGIGPDGTAHYHFYCKSKEQTERFLKMIAAEGSCVIVIDDSRRITANAPDYGLSGYVDQLLTIGAAIGLIIIICANSTNWVTSGLRDQCAINLIGQMANERERSKFLEIAGLPKKELLPVLNNIKPRHFLYSDRYDGSVRLGITTYAA